MDENSHPMTSNKPYLIRALHEWIVDNNLTPYIAVNALVEGVSVPEKYIDNGKIIFNISPSVVQGLHINNDVIHFNARFSGVGRHIIAPINSIMAIYARENGRGMVFPEEEVDNGGSTEPPRLPPTKNKAKLTVVK